VHGTFAKHDIRGTLNLLESLGMVAKPVQRKRSTTAGGDGIPFQSRKSGSDDLFVAQVNGQLFRKSTHETNENLTLIAHFSRKQDTSRAMWNG